MDMIGYVDADYAGDHATRRSMTDYIFTLNGTVVMWASQRKEVVVLSTCETDGKGRLNRLKRLSGCGHSYENWISTEDRYSFAAIIKGR